MDSKLAIAKRKKFNRLKTAGLILTILGLGLFSYFIYTVGIDEIYEGIGRIGFGGFAIIILIYFCRILIRAQSWKLSVSKPYKLGLKDTIPAVIMGEAVSSVVPLGILASGTTKAFAVRHRIPLVAGFSSVATENLFYSLVTGTFIALGAAAFLRHSEPPREWVIVLDLLIGGIALLIALGAIMVIRQWHWASGLCEFLYRKGILTGPLENGKGYVRTFEDTIYGFYRKYPKRFFPILMMQVVFHSLGVLEVFFILGRISDSFPTFFSAFLLETASRVITVVFKLVPFLMGIDEAGSQFVAESLALGAGIGVTIAVVRKGRILFWALIGMALIFSRGISIREIMQKGREEIRKGR